MTVSEKIKTMQPEEVAYFFREVFKEESFLDDLYCEKCKEKYGSCPVGEKECLSYSVDLIKWFLELPFAEVEKKLFGNGFTHFWINRD